MTDVQNLLASNPNIANGLIPSGTDEGLKALHLAAGIMLLVAEVVTAPLTTGTNRTVKVGGGSSGNSFGPHF